MPTRPARPAGLAAGVDLGSHGVRVAVLESGRVLATAEREYPPPPPPTRRSLSEVWATTALAFAEVDAELLSRVETLSLTGVRGAVVGIDPLSGRTTDVYPDYDTSSLAEAAELRGRLGPSAVALTGCPAFPLSGLPKLLAHRGQAPVWTSLPDAVTWHATGELWLSTAMALRLGVLGADGRGLARELLARLAFDPASLAPLAPVGARLGILMPDPAAQLGLPVGIPVIAAPGDGPCALIAAAHELASSGHVLLACLGTTSVASTPVGPGLARMLPTDATYEILAADPLAPLSRAVETGDGSGTHLVDWACRILDVLPDDLDQLAADATDVPDIALPSLDIWGGAPATPALPPVAEAELAAAVLHAVADGAVAAVQRIARVARPDVVVLTGGGSRSQRVAERIAGRLPYDVVALPARQLAAEGAALVADGRADLARAARSEEVPA